MKKIFLTALLAALVCSMPLTAQGSGEPSAQTVVNWIAHPAYSTSGSDPKRVGYLTEAVADWQKSHPDVTLVSNVLSTNNAEAMAKLLEQAAQGRAPDVAQIDTYVLPRYLPYLQPIDDLVEEAGIDMDDFFPFAGNIVRGGDGKVRGK